MFTTIFSQHTYDSRLCYLYLVGGIQNINGQMKMKNSINRIVQKITLNDTPYGFLDFSRPTK